MDDAADDWHQLFEIEDALWPLATHLTAAISGVHGDLRWTESEVRHVTTSLIWVGQHRYDALEADMQRHLDIALRCGMSALDRLQAPMWRHDAPLLGASNGSEQVHPRRDEDRSVQYATAITS
jgi:hypothetical protein